MKKILMYYMSNGAFIYVDTSKCIVSSTHDWINYAQKDNESCILTIYKANIIYTITKEVDGDYYKYIKNNDCWKCIHE